MAIYLKKFENHTQYENYINGSGAILPNVSLCVTENDVHYNPYVEPVETRLVCKYNVEDTEYETTLCYDTGNFSAMEIDGVEQQNVTTGYTFSTTGEHTVKYTLTDPTIIGESAFEDCSSLTSVTIPNSVTSTDYGVFRYCSGMKICTIGSGVTDIYSNSFRDCYSLTNINIPPNLVSIDSGAFCNCNSLDETTVAAIEAINEYALECD